MSKGVLIAAISMLAGACQLAGANGGAGAPAPTGQAGTCGESSVPVDDWAAIVAGYQGKVRSVPRSAFEACTAANRIVTMCPSYDPKMVETRLDVCAAAVRQDIAPVEASMNVLSMKLPAMKALGQPIGDLWVNVDDGSLAVSVARLEALKPTAAEQTALLARVALLRKEAAELDEAKAAAGQAPGGCSGFTALQERAQAMVGKCKGERATERICPYVAGTFTGEVEARRQRATDGPTLEIRRIIGENPGMAEADDPDSFRGAITKVRDLTSGMKCFDPERIAKWEPELIKWASEREAAIEAEKKCRVAPSCMAERIAPDICRALEAKREAEGELATKRRYAAAHGVADLSELHDLSVRIQEADSAVAQHRARYLAAVKRPFGGTCR